MKTFYRTETMTDSPKHRAGYTHSVWSRTDSRDAERVAFVKSVEDADYALSQLRSGVSVAAVKREIDSINRHGF